LKIQYFFFNGCNGLGIILLFQRRYTNRPIVELANAAQEELKITELRLAKLFSSEPTVPSHPTEHPTIQSDKAAGIDSILSVYRFLLNILASFVVSTHICIHAQRSKPCI